MIGAWIQFSVTAVLLAVSLICFSCAVIGAYRFGFVLNRMHAAGIGDSLALFCAIAGTIVAAGLNMDALKLVLLIVFMWFTSPASSHFLSQVEYFTNRHLYRYVDREGQKPEETAQRVLPDRPKGETEQEKRNDLEE